MTTLLQLNSSSQHEQRSITRQLGSRFRAEWLSILPDSDIIHRDLASSPIPPVSADWIAAAFTPEDKRSAQMRKTLELSDRLIQEVEQADVIVLGAPMYNYGMPAALKAWFDQIARIGRTFSFDLSRGDFPIEPMLSGKTLVVLSSRGEFGFEPGGARAHLNSLDPAISACAHYLGVASSSIHTITVEYQEFKDERHSLSLRRATAATETMARTLASRARSASASEEHHLRGRAA